MTLQIAITVAILILAVILFITERLRMDVVALLVLVALALTGLVTPAEALSGFSNPAVVTVWAVFILSGGLSRTGVANVVGRQVLRLAGQSEARLVVVIMLTAGVMSAFMNNVGVAALLLPVVMDISRRIGRPPSKLLMPLAFGALLGGLTTLIGTPPNILISDALRDSNLRAFQLFDYTPVGVAVMLAGVAFMTLIGRYLLPVRDLARESSALGQTDVREFYHLRERLFVMRVPDDSVLAGKALVDSRLGSALGLNVIAILRDDQTQLAPDPYAVLRPGDRLLVEGRLERLTELQGRSHLVVEDGSLDVERLVSSEINLARVALSPRSSLLGQTLLELDFRRHYGVIVLAIWRDDVPKWTNLDNTPLQVGDVLLVQGPRAQVEALRDIPDFLVSSAEQAEVYRLHERLMVVRVPRESTLVGKTLAESRLGDVFGLTVLGIVRQNPTHLSPAVEERLQAGDMLLVKGNPEDLLRLRALQDLEIDRQTPPDLRKLESERIGLAEVVLSPHTTLVGKTLRQLHFREKYGLSVLAIWREGQAYRSNLRNMALRFGDALLLYGPREKLKVLGSEPDFLVLTEEAQEVPRLNKAPLAALVMGSVLLPVIIGWLPISIASVAGALLMVLTGCLTMEEAYRFIEWRAVFLIAGMLPLGIAMAQTGAARFLTEGMVAMIGGFGPLAVIAGLYALTTLATQVMPNAAVAVLLAPIALSTAGNMGVSPYTLMMAVALAASASFLSPVAHPANVLIMGPGGYRFSDYIKVGVPLTLVVLIATLLVLPIFWPL
ncbi:MAG: SLC13 family permease [Anaerolineae bacterium]